MFDWFAISLNHPSSGVPEAALATRLPDGVGVGMTNTKMMKTVGYGKGYAYDHDADEGFSGQDYWPEGMEAQDFYEPTDRGFEAKVRERLAYWEQRRKELQQSGGGEG